MSRFLTHWSVHIALAGLVFLVVGIQLNYGNAEVGFISTGKHLVLLLGELLFPIGLITFIYERMLRGHMLDDTRSALRNELDNHWKLFTEHDECVKSITWSGLVAVHKELDVVSLCRKIQQADKLVLTMTPGCPEPKDALPRAFRLALERNKNNNEFQCRVLVADQNSPWVMSRANERKKMPPEGSGLPLHPAVWSVPYIEAVQAEGCLDDAFKASFSMRVFQTNPSFDLYLVDDTAFIGFYVHTGYAYRKTQLQVRIREGNEYTHFGQFIIEEFDRIYGLRSTIDVQEYMAKAADSKL